MIVPSVWHDVWVDLDAVGGSGHMLPGYVGQEEQREKETKPRRPIGFRMPEKPVDPSWMLL